MEMILATQLEATSGRMEGAFQKPLQMPCQRMLTAHSHLKGAFLHLCLHLLYVHALTVRVALCRSEHNILAEK